LPAPSLQQPVHDHLPGHGRQQLHDSGSKVRIHQAGRAVQAGLAHLLIGTMGQCRRFVLQAQNRLGARGKNLFRKPPLPRGEGLPEQTLTLEGESPHLLNLLNRVMPAASAESCCYGPPNPLFRKMGILPSAGAGRPPRPAPGPR
jgi:hypothetical protein